MKATIKLEYIGESQDARLSMYSKIIDQVADGLGGKVTGNTRLRQPWVAEIAGIDSKFGFKREFLKGNWQRKKSNGTGSRGTELWFTIESGKIYEVKSPISWRSINRYFCLVTETGGIKKITETEVKKWLKDHLE